MSTVLIRRPVLDAIAAGTVTVAFRRWDRPRVLPGSRLRTAVGVLEVGTVEAVDAAELTAADAHAAGYADLPALLAALRSPTPPAAIPREGDRRLYRITLRLAGPDPRAQLREQAGMTVDERAELAARLDRLDRASRRGPWTSTVLELIAANPGVRAPDLAQRLGLETLPFKRDVRKLKELGLTESLPVGYRLSPRGRAYLR
jgi:hypothetical protein